MTNAPADPPPDGPPSSAEPLPAPPRAAGGEVEPSVLFWFYVRETVPMYRSDGSELGKLDPGTWYAAHEEADAWTSTTDASGRSGWLDSARINRAPPGDPPSQPEPQSSPVAYPVAPPPPAVPLAPTAESATAAPKRHGCRRFFLIVVAALLIVGVGGFLLVRSGYLSPTALQARLSGVGSITVVNITDDELGVRLVGEEEVSDNTSIEALDIDGFGALEPGSYTVTFESSAGVPATLECVLELSRGQDYQFVAVPEGIAVTVGDSAQSADEVDAATSSLCGGDQ